MRIHLLHIAKFAALVALAVVITHTLSYPGRVSHEHPRRGARATHSDVQASASGIPLKLVSAETVNLKGVRAGDVSCRAEADQPVVGFDHAPEEIATESDGGIISGITQELKATVTLIRAYTSWVRTSPETTS